MRYLTLTSLLLAILFPLSQVFADEITLTAPAEPYASHSVRSQDNLNWEYQPDGNDVRAGTNEGWEYRGFVRFNTDALAPGTVIEGISLQLTVSQASVDPSILVDARALGYYPSSDNPADVANAIITSGNYIDDWNLLQAEGEYTVPLNENAISILQSSINDGRTWFAVGFVGFHNGENSDGVIAGYTSPTPPQLIVDFRIPFVAAPTDLAYEITPDNEIALTWTDNSDNETGFYISRTYRPSLDVEPERWEAVAVLDPNTTEHTDAEEIISGYYQYRVRAFNDEIASDWSYTDEFQVVLPPLGPAFVSADYINSELIEVSWEDRAADETHYLVERRHQPLDDGWDEWTLVEPNFPANTELISFALETTGTFHFRVAAANDQGVSDWVLSNTVFAPPMPDAPSDFAAEYIQFENDVVLTWVDHASYEDGFHIDRRYNDGNGWTDWELVAALDPDIVTWTDFFVSIGPLYQYRLRAHNVAGVSDWITVETGISPADDASAALPLETRLLGNYPNPFNPSTDIAFELASRAHLTLTVYNLLGEEIARLADQPFAAGRHTVQFNAHTLSAGIYFYELRAGDFVSTQKMILLK